MSATPNPLVITPVAYHTADYRDARWVIDGTEVNRVLSYWRAAGYQPNVAGADGYASGLATPSSSGPRHAADYRDPAWVIDGTEVNRVLSYWRAAGYQVNAAGADGYSSGLAPAAVAGVAGVGSGGGSARQSAERVATATTTLTQTGPAGYVPGGTVTITNRLVYTGTLDSLLLAPQLPANWTVASVAGDGAPEFSNGEIVPVGTLPAGQVEIRYTVNVPTGETGGKTIRTRVETQYRGDVNPGTAFASPDPLGIAGPNVAPTVSLSASASTVTQGDTVTLTATATDSDGTVTKVEFFDGATKLGEDTTAPYSLMVSTLAAGAHSLTAKATDNAGATTTSAPVTVTVNTPVGTGFAILVQPRDQTVVVGSSVTLSVSAMGQAPLTYQWRKDGTTLAGATSSALPLNNVALNQGGTYTVLVTDAVGSLTSAPAQLVVTTSLFQPPAPQSTAAIRSQGFGLNLLVETGRAFRVQAATELRNPVWTDVTNFVSTGAAVQFLDAAATNQTKRFYRIVSP